MNGDCPTGQFSADKQVVFDSSTNDISAATVWTKDKLYLVKTNVVVKASLTIEAGTTVCFGGDSGFSGDLGALLVGEYETAALEIQGTENEHVTLTAIDSAKGWGGVHVYGNATKIDVAYTDFLFGSRADGVASQHFSYGALRIRDNSSGAAAPPARLHHVTFSGAKQGGPLWLESDAGLTPDSVVLVTAFNLTQNDLQFTDSAVVVTPEAASSLAPGMISIAPEVPESKRGVELLSGNISANSTVRAIELPYLAPHGLVVSNSVAMTPVSLTIEGGAELRLGSAAVIQVGLSGPGTQGDLILDGTAAKPVKLVYYAFPNSFSDRWGGLYFTWYDAGVSRVSHATLQTAGESGFAQVSDACGDSSSRGVIMLESPTGGGGSNYPALVIDHTTIDGSVSNGIVAECSIGCIDATANYMDPALGNEFLNITKKPQILATCP